MFTREVRHKEATFLLDTRIRRQCLWGRSGIRSVQYGKGKFEYGRANCNIGRADSNTGRASFNTRTVEIIVRFQ